MSKEGSSRASACRAYHHGDVAASALDAAAELLSEGGLAAVTLRKVAERVGVNHRALYRHFASLDALLGRLAETGFHDLAMAVSKAGSRAKFIEAYIGFAIERPGLYDVMMSRPSAAFSPGEPLHDALEHLLAVVRSAMGVTERVEDRQILRIWMTLHGGVALRRNGIVRPLPDDAFIALMCNLADPQG